MHPRGLNPAIVPKVVARRGRLHAWETIDPHGTALVVTDLNRASVPTRDYAGGEGIQRMIDRYDLEGLSLADVLERLEKGRIGHRAAMDWLGIDSIEELVRIMHFNDREMPGHRPMHIPRETRELLRRVTRPLPKQAAE